MTTSSHLFDANWYLTSPRTPSFLSRVSPNLGFYAPMIWIVFKAGRNAMRNQYDGEAWAQSSEGIAHALESVGCRIEAAGMEHFRSLEGPCVFIGNHMSTLETFVLPSMIQPWKDVTFVVKESLLKYPFFGPCSGRASPSSSAAAIPVKISSRCSRAARRGSSKAVPSLFFRRARAVPFSTPRISIPSASSLPSAPGFRSFRWRSRPMRGGTGTSSKISARWMSKRPST